MTSQPELPPHVVSFVRDNIDTLQQLELLALVMEEPDRWWDAPAVARALLIDVAMARLALEALASRNLLAIKLTTDVRYQFQPGTSILRENGEAFAEAYLNHPVAVVRLVTEGQRRALRDFANAFRVR
jgi:hypothetical protein